VREFRVLGVGGLGWVVWLRVAGSLTGLCVWLMLGCAFRFETMLWSRSGVVLFVVGG
jgi:hypothetical protein